MKKLLTLTLLLAAGSMCPRAAWLERVKAEGTDSLIFDLTHTNNNQKYEIVRQSYADNAFRTPIYNTDYLNGKNTTVNGLGLRTHLSNFPVPWAENNGAYMVIKNPRNGGRLFLQKKNMEQSGWPYDLVFTYWTTDPNVTEIPNEVYEVDDSKRPLDKQFVFYTKNPNQKLYKVCGEDKFTVGTSNGQIILEPWEPCNK